MVKFLDEKPCLVLNSGAGSFIFEISRGLGFELVADSEDAVLKIGGGDYKFTDFGG